MGPGNISVGRIHARQRTDLCENRVDGIERGRPRIGSAKSFGKLAQHTITVHASVTDTNRGQGRQVARDQDGQRADRAIPEAAARVSLAKGANAEFGRGAKLELAGAEGDPHVRAAASAAVVTTAFAAPNLLPQPANLVVTTGVRTLQHASYAGRQVQESLQLFAVKVDAESLRQDISQL